MRKRTSFFKRWHWLCHKKISLKHQISGVTRREKLTFCLRDWLGATPCSQYHGNWTRLALSNDSSPKSRIVLVVLRVQQVGMHERLHYIPWMLWFLIKHVDSGCGNLFAECCAHYFSSRMNISFSFCFSGVVGLEKARTNVFCFFSSKFCSL